MIGADLWSAVVTGSVPVAWAAGILTMSHVLAAAFGVGLGAVFFRTAYASLVPEVVAKGDLEQANSRLYGTEAAMQVAGPGVGGGLVSLIGAAYAVVLDTVTFLVSALCLLRMRTSAAAAGDGEVAAQQAVAPRESMLVSVRAGLRILWRDPYIRFAAWQGGVSNFALTGYGALMVLYLVRDLGLEPGWVGVVMAVGSVGGLIGAGVARRVSTRLGPGPAMVWLQVLGGPTALLIAVAGPGLLVVLVPLGGPSSGSVSSAPMCCAGPSGCATSRRRSWPGWSRHQPWSIWAPCPSAGSARAGSAIVSASGRRSPCWPGCMPWPRCRCWSGPIDSAGRCRRSRCRCPERTGA